MADSPGSLSSLLFMLGCVLIPIQSVLKSSPVCRRRKKLKMSNCTDAQGGERERESADVLVKNQERASAEQVTLFLTSQPHQKFFQVSFCVAKDDNGESISAWNEKKPPVCPRGERFHTRQPSLNFRHSSAPFCVRKRRLFTDFSFFFSLSLSLYKKVRGEYIAEPSRLSRHPLFFFLPVRCRRGVIWRCAWCCCCCGVVHLRLLCTC